MAVDGASSHLDTGGLVDQGASATSENLSRWTPRKGDGSKGDSAKFAEPEIFGSLASRNHATLRATHLMGQMGLDVATANLLEVGSGYGDGLRPFMMAGFLAENMTGIDLMVDRIPIAERQMPGAHFMHGNGAHMEFADSSFDVTVEQYCFCHNPDEEAKKAAALEMIRVTKPGGFIVVHDWRVAWPRRHIYGPSQPTIREWFRVGDKTKKIASLPSMLWPPIGNRVSRLSVPAYLSLTAIPALVGSRFTLLRKV